MSEIDRVREAYARRHNAERYDPRRPDVIDRVALRNRVWGRHLLHSGTTLGTVVEIGCGTGEPLRWALGLGAERAIGIDAIEDRLRVGRAMQPQSCVVLGDAQRLPLAASSADVVLLSTLVSSILDEGVAERMASEAVRILKPAGVILWFDFCRDNPRNPDVRGISRRSVRRLFPGCVVSLESVVLAPPIAARLHRWPRVASILEMLPPLRTHLAGSVRPG